MEFIELTKNDLIEAIEQNKIEAYEVTELSPELLLDQDVLLTFLSEDVIPLEFVLQNPIVRREYELNIGIHQAVMLSKSELRNLWFKLELAANKDYNIIVESLSEKFGTVKNDEDYDKIWVVYGLYPGMKQIKKIFNNRIPTSNDIEVISSEILNSNYNRHTVQRELLYAIKKADRIRAEYDRNLSEFFEEMCVSKNDKYFFADNRAYKRSLKK